MALILTFGVDDKSLKGLKALGRKKSVRIRRVLPEEYLTPIGALAGRDIRAGIPEMGPVGQMLVFCDVTEKQLDMLLGEIKNARIAQTALMAMLTEHNLMWTAPTLWRELLREHRELGGE